MGVTEVPNRLSPLQSQTLRFKGLNRQIDISDGEMREMKNLTARHFPMLDQRLSRGLLPKSTYRTDHTGYPTGEDRLIRLLVRYEKLCCLNEITESDGTTRVEFIYGYGEEDEFRSYDTEYEFSSESKMVSINQYICIFPEKVYFNAGAYEQGITDVSYLLGHLEVKDVFETIKMDSGDGDFGLQSITTPVTFTITNGNSAISTEYATLKLVRNRFTVAPNMDAFYGDGLKPGDAIQITPTNCKEAGMSANNYTKAMTNYAVGSSTQVNLKEMRNSIGLSVAEGKKHTVTLTFSPASGEKFAQRSAAVKVFVSEYTDGAYATTDFSKMVNLEYKGGKLTGTFGFTPSKSSLNYYIRVARLPLHHTVTYVDGSAVSLSATMTTCTGVIYTQKTVDDTELSCSCVIQAIEDDTLYLPSGTFNYLDALGLESKSISCDTLEISRPCPNLDHVVESNNRLWGCNSEDNTIYASKLGDPTNWNYFQNTSLDSYYANQGTDGDWTGCIDYGEHLCFFKENSCTRIYGSFPSEYQSSTLACYGVEKDSPLSLININGSVFYKAKQGVMVYEGGIPEKISDDLGDEKYTNVVSGSDGKRLYMSMYNQSRDEYELMVYDTEPYAWAENDSSYSSRFWHKEDDSRALSFAYFRNQLMFADEVSNEVVIVDADNPTEDDSNLDWYAIFGPYNEVVEERKVYSRMHARFVLSEGASIKISLMINPVLPISRDEGEWEEYAVLTSDREDNEGLVYDDWEQTMDVPIVPRRCDRFAIKIEGTGRCRVESFSRRYRVSTMRRDVKF